MKKFLKILLIFIAILVTSAILLDCFISYRLRHSESRMFKAWSYIYNDSTDYDIVINGGSRAWVQYNPEIIDSALGTKTINLGIDGSAINRQIIKYRAYCREHRAIPALLIQNIDFTTINITKDLEREQFFPYFFYDKFLIESADESEHFSLFDKFLPIVRYYGYSDAITSALFRRRLGPELKKGYCGREECWDGTLFRQQDTIYLNANPDALAMFNEFIADVVSDGTKVVFVFAPIYSEVNDKIPDINIMYELFENIANQYQIPILNYNEIQMCNDTTFFYNATHLNKSGAELFSRKLARDIDSLRIVE